MTSAAVTRRGFLAVAAATSTISAASSRVTATQSRTVRGKIVDYTGEPVDGRSVNANGTNYTTDSSGNFEFSTDQDPVRLGFYKTGSDNQLHAPVENNVPHISDLGRYSLEEDGVDIGEIQLDKASTVDLRALDESGDPASNAKFRVQSGLIGSGSSGFSVNEDGYLQIDGADFTGVELAGSSSVTIKIPKDGPGSEMIPYSESLIVDSDVTVTAKASEGTTVEESQSSTTTAATTEEVSTTKTPTTTTETPTETSTVLSTTSTGKTTQGTTSATTTNDNSTTTTPVTSNQSTNQRPRRGLFSNGDSAMSSNRVTDPFVITVGGFVLSVAGLVHNLLRGG